MADGLPKETNPEGFTFETKAPPLGFKDVHPMPGIVKKWDGKDTVPWGGSDGLESEYFRCKQCGFVNNKKRNSPGSGWGNNIDVPIPGSTATDPQGTSGCPLCNSSEAE